MIIRALQSDRRIPYYLRLPSGGAPKGLLVAIHGSDRRFIEYAEGFVALAERQGLAIVAPLFAIGIAETGNADGFKYLYEDGVDYARTLLDIVAEVAAETGCPAETFLLCGFSGGGQFVHRFYYLYPERLRAVAIGAPGSVSLVDAGQVWWTGTADAQGRFGRAPDPAAMRRVPVQLVVGAEDRFVYRLSTDPADRYYALAEIDDGANRIERTEMLGRHLTGLEIAHTLVQVPGVGHDAALCTPAMVTFFDAELAAKGDS